MNTQLVFVAATAALWAAGPAAAAGHAITGPRLSVTVADPDTGWTPDNANRVDHIAWVDSSGAAVQNWVANGGPLHCNDPQEFFGQAYGEPEGAWPPMVIAGYTSTWSGSRPRNGKSKTTGAQCGGDPSPPALTTTGYKVFGSGGQVNEMQVTRKFLFGAGTPVFNGKGLRAFVPRLPAAVYGNVVVPRADGSGSYIVQSWTCTTDCEISDWNGRWFADEDGSGHGMMVIRSASSTAPAMLAVNHDSFTDSNLSSVVLLQPEGGWKAPVSETEYLCFYDPVSWPASRRAALQMPIGCEGTRP